MLERRRKNKHYEIVPGEEPGDEDEERDVELGAVRGQETGSVPIEANGQAEAGAGKGTDVTEELDNWDENEEDWEDGPAAVTPSGEVVKNVGDEGGDTKKRVD